MPLYDYGCDHCGTIQEEFRYDTKPIKCWKCGGTMRRKWSLGRGVRSGEGRGFWSRSMGVAPEQVADEQRRHPDWQFNQDGDLYIRNPQDKKRKLQELGMTDFQ